MRYFNRLFIFEEFAANTRFAMAISLLKRFSLIRFDPAPKGFYIMHPFAQEVLKEEFGSRKHETVARVLMASNEVGEEVKEAGKGELEGIIIPQGADGVKSITWGPKDIDMTLFIQNTKYNTEAISWMIKNSAEFFKSVAKSSGATSKVLIPLRIESGELAQGGLWSVAANQ